MDAARSASGKGVHVSNMTISAGGSVDRESLSAPVGSEVRHVAGVGHESLVLGAIERRVGREAFARFFADTVRVNVSADAVRLITASEFLAERLSRRFGEAVREAVLEVFGDGSRTVTFVARPVSSVRAASEDQPNAAAARRDADRAPAPSRRRRSVPSQREDIDRTLETFVVGACNELAYRAAVAIADPEHAAALGVLFLHGDCGVGKTHLLKGLAERFARLNPGARVLYTTGEAFTNAYLTALKRGEVDAFRARHRGLDLLCLDDVHFLANKTHTQTEFLHTFDQMDLNGARVAVASDDAPAKIGRFSRELVSRFSAGVVAEMRTPDAATRPRLVAALAKRSGLALTDDAARVIAERCPGSAREIDGVIKKLHAVCTLLPMGRAFGPVLDAGAVRAALGPGFAPRPMKPVRVEAIVEITADALGVTVPEMLGATRRRRVVVARSMASHLARKIAGRSFQEIAEALGRPTHSTVFTACRRVEEKIASREAVDAGPDLAVSNWAELEIEIEGRLRARRG